MTAKSDLLEGKVSLNGRPVKIAYFVGENDQAGLRRAIQLCCTQWGGIRNLIIPVQPDGTIPAYSLELLKIHPPDRFVSYVPEPDRNDPTVRRGLEAMLVGL